MTMKMTMAMTGGSLVVAGLGPGNDAMVTPEVRDALAAATDIIGYFPYVARIAPRKGLTLHGSDNRVELERATHALQLAAAGRHVVIVSSGDPGVFAMASALFEAMETGEPSWQGLDIRILPGITAMLAAAAAAGAPLGHDFCAINLSDNLKPMDLVLRRIRLALEGDFAMAFYNPRSHSRRGQFDSVIALLRQLAEPERIVILARAVSTPEQTITVIALAQLEPEMVDMRTLVIIGSSRTRCVGRFTYTPRAL